MLSCYITPEEFYRFHDLKRFVRDAARVTEALVVSTANVVADLRNKDIRVERMYIPRMFDGAVGTRLTKSISYTSGPITGGNELRMVIDLPVDGGGTFVLHGSYDKDVWSTIPLDPDASIVVADSGRYSGRYNERHRYYRYTFTPNIETTYSAFLVDTSADRLIRYSTIMTLLFPLLGQDGAPDSLYAEARQMYQNELQVFRYDYDTDESLSVEDTEQDTSRRVRLYR